MYFLLSFIIYIVNCVVSGEIYTAGKNFTLPPAVTAWTNLTSGFTSNRYIGNWRTKLMRWVFLRNLPAQFFPHCFLTVQLSEIVAKVNKENLAGGK